MWSPKSENRLITIDPLRTPNPGPKEEIEEEASFARSWQLLLTGRFRKHGVRTFRFLKLIPGDGLGFRV